MKKATLWSLLVVFGALPMVLAAINTAAPSSPTTGAGELATGLFNSFGQFTGVLYLIVGVAIVSTWAYAGTSGGGF